ncbi:MAG: hypothetical protein J6A15_03575 [Clostridia bacterium]|nr:hypothetical protein [Clostridia bacterium]
MDNRWSENYNLELMDSVPVALKQPLRELIAIMLNSTLLYSKDDVIKLLEDLKSRRLAIKVEKVITSQNNVGNALDRVAFGYGYVDFGKESIFYKNELDKKIIIWEEILRNRYQTFS